MNLGRMLEVILVVIIVVYFASQAHVMVHRRSSPHTQTVNRVLAYYLLTEVYNASELKNLLLKMSSDVVRVEDFKGTTFGAATHEVIYDSGWPYGYYLVKAVNMGAEYTVVVVRVRG